MNEQMEALSFCPWNRYVARTLRTRGAPSTAVRRFPRSSAGALQRLIAVALSLAALRGVFGSGPKECFDSFPYQAHGDNVLHNRKGVLLWSWGRSGTGTIWYSLRDTLAESGITMNATCGKKEGLPGSCLNSNTMRK